MRVSAARRESTLWPCCNCWRAVRAAWHCYACGGGAGRVAQRASCGVRHRARPVRKLLCHLRATAVLVTLAQGVAQAVRGRCAGFVQLDAAHGCFTRHGFRIRERRKLLPTIPKPDPPPCLPPSPRVSSKKAVNGLQPRWPAACASETGRTKCTCDRFPYRASARMVDCTIACAVPYAATTGKRHGHSAHNRQSSRNRGNDNCSANL